MYHSRRYSNSSHRRRRRYRKRHARVFPWPLLLVLFFIFSGSSFSIIILLLLGIGLLQMLTSSSRQYYEPPEYLGNSGPSSDVHVSYVEEPVKPKATFDAQYCIECGSKLGRKEVYCRFCGTRQ